MCSPVGVLAACALLVPRPVAAEPQPPAVEAQPRPAAADAAPELAAGEAGSEHGQGEPSPPEDADEADLDPPPPEPSDDGDYQTTVRAGGPGEDTHGRAASRVGRREIQERIPRSTPDALVYEPGVFVQQTAAGQASAFVRGRTGQQTVLLFDGIRLNNSLWRQGPNQYFFTLDAATIHAIDVVRGSASVRHGSDAIGGAIDAVPIEAPLWTDLHDLQAWPRNTLRLSSQDEQVAERFQLEAQWDRFGLIAGAGWRTVGLLESGGAVVGTDGRLPWVPRFEEDGCTPLQAVEDPDHCRTQLGTGFDELTFDARAAYDLGRDRKIVAAVYGYRQYDAPRTDQCPPAEGRWDECLTYEEQFRTLAYVSYRGLLADGVAEDAQLTFSYQRQHERRRLDRPASFSSLGGIDDVDTYGFVGSIRMVPLELGGDMRLTFRYGGEVYHDRIGSMAWTGFSDTDQVVFASRGQYLEGSSYTTGGLYLEPELDLGAGVVVSVGGRFGGTQAVAPADEVTGSAAIDASWITPVGRLGVAWAPWSWLTWRTNVDHAFRAPNLDDLTSRQQTGPGFQFENPDLRPEQALTVETGLELRLDWLQADVWGYWTPVWDAMARAPRQAADCPPATSTCGGARARYQLVNLPGRADLFGVELSALAELPLGFSLRATLAWAWGEGPNPSPAPDDPDVPHEETLPLSRIPPLNGTAELRWQADWGLYAGAALRWATAQDRLALQDLSDPRIPYGGTPGYAVLDLSAGFRWRRNLLLGLVVENVTDTAWRTHGSSVNGPGVGASVLLEVGL
ncbi:MAG: TonB-dependent receptor [Deltaproteobacteria bacterium]|nr:TonB-dependent receptor [Deltaproteobacteria bacterium]